MIVYFHFLLQKELDIAVKIWNSHYIRRSANAAPSGRPDVMYRFPSLWNAEDQIVKVTQEDFAACAEEVEFRSVIPCDPDVYEVCVVIMRRCGLLPANSCREAIDLYLLLRTEIQTAILITKCNA